MKKHALDTKRIGLGWSVLQKMLQPEFSPQNIYFLLLSIQILFLNQDHKS